jgi:hypothetical protein
MMLFESSTNYDKHQIRGGRWFSWSSSLLKWVERNSEWLRKISHPRLIEVRECKPYESTYDVPLGRIRSLVSDGLAHAFASAVDGIQPGKTLMLLDNMLEPPVDSRILYSIFVVLRASMVATHRDSGIALFSPVKPERHDNGFPLHADLFLRSRLLIVFDDVMANCGGDSLFLGRDDLFEICDDIGVPVSTKNRLRSMFESPCTNDCFDELYDLLHGAHAWVDAMERSFEGRQQVISLKRGQGYLLDDRQWLHGRTATRIPVRMARFRRLVF